MASGTSVISVRSSPASCAFASTRIASRFAGEGSQPGICPSMYAKASSARSLGAASIGMSMYGISSLLRSHLHGHLHVVDQLVEHVAMLRELQRCAWFPLLDRRAHFVGVDARRGEGHVGQ